MNSDSERKIVENKIKKSFFLVKKDVLDIKKEIKSIKSSLKSILRQINENKAESSTGNEGVLINNQSIINQRSINNQSTINRESKQKSEERTIKETKKKMINRAIELEEIIKSLTEREFQIFMLIYQLEEEKGKVSYKDISERLNLTQSVLRGRVSIMIQKGTPLVRSRPYHKITYLSVPKEIRDLNIAGELIKLKDPDSKQTTLFDL